ncbi:hypothetical protein [Paenibacillus sp. ISL-20]|uniref:hypothetical protein n=1 Tax=Paenibacillus sp. ISL-20 TaxID=2819163 RepID=UPI001BE904FB|nr:hypothetical protein [Paenibacillus sp. ISL-20]MBT2764434.1 hypothetical protein [Paenibacillus sp. ISL-20]
MERIFILQSVKAIEGYVLCSCIAIGLLQLITVLYSGRVPGLFFRYLRTPSKTVVSEATVMAFLRNVYFSYVPQNPHLSITKIIRSKHYASDIDADSLTS